MKPTDYLRILRRRWWILVVGALLGCMLAFITRPTETAILRATAPSVQYRAQHLLQTKDGATAGSVGFDRLALQTLYGQVPNDALKKLNAAIYGSTIKDTGSNSSSSSSSDSSNSSKRKQAKATDPGLPKVRQGKGTILVLGPDIGIVEIAVVPDPSTGALAIIGTGSRDGAVKAANVFAETLMAHLDQVGVDAWNRSLAANAAQRQVLVDRVGSLDFQISVAPADPGVNMLIANRGDLQRRVDSIDQDVALLKKQGPQKSPLETLDPASGNRETLIVGASGSAVTGSQRLIVGGGIGLFLALALLITIELLGARVRDVASTEAAARMPVIAEIPMVKMNRADRFVVATSSDPSSLTAEAYRSLRTSLLAMWQRHPRNVALAAEIGAHTNGNGNGHLQGPNVRGRPLRTLLVTSPGPAEGKSISVVNLAAAFAETGMTVIVIDADFRRPTQTRYLERPRNPNLGDLDLYCEPEDLEAILQETDVPGVRLAASAPSRSDPGHSIAVAKSAVQAAVHLADIVIVDSPPLLLANDSSDLALGVDASILLARSGWTRRGGIVASAELMRRLEATVIGVVIVGAEHGVRAGYYGYYGYYGYGYGYAHPGEVSIMKRLMPWKAGRKPRTPGPVAPVPSAPRSGTSTALADPPPGVSSPQSAADLDEPWV